MDACRERECRSHILDVVGPIVEVQELTTQHHHRYKSRSFAVAVLDHIGIFHQAGLRDDKLTERVIRYNTNPESVTESEIP